MLSINTIVVPQGAEYQAVCRGLRKAKVNDVEVIAIPIGARFADRILLDHGDQLNSLSPVLIIGLCGALGSYSIGDAVLVTDCKDREQNQVNLNQELTVQIQQKLAIETVTALTSDRLITQASTKMALAQKYQASIVEMEGYCYVNKLQQQEVSVAMLRVVSDDAHGDIPDLNQAIDESGNLQTLPMAIALLRQPFAAVRLIKGSLTGLKALEQITRKLFAS
ncbi:MAG: phosphorylase [Cyanobacteria bacterium J06600_6]